MEIKWFFVIFGIVFTAAILLGQLFIGTYINKLGDARFDNSTVVHKYLFDNITDVKKGLDPILAVIPNATQAEIERQIHYNQTTADFQRIEQVLEIKLQDHVTLGVLNQSVFKILEILNGTGSSTENETIIPIPVPVVVVEEENVTEPIINNVTEQFNKTGTDDRGLPL